MIKISLHWKSYGRRRVWSIVCWRRGTLFTEPSPEKGCSLVWLMQPRERQSESGGGGGWRGVRLGGVCLCKQKERKKTSTRWKSIGDVWWAPWLLIGEALQRVAVKHTHQSHVAATRAMMDALLTRRGDENKCDKEAERLWQPRVRKVERVGGKKFFFFLQRQSKCPTCFREILSVALLQLMYFWQSGERSYKQISVAFFVLIFDRHLHKTFRTPDYFRTAKPLSMALSCRSLM